MKIKFYDSTWAPNTGDFTNQLVLYKDYWNDYGYRTSYYLVFCDSEGNVHSIGSVKIYHYNHDEMRNQRLYGDHTSLEITSEIEQLDEKFCSLGQSLNYYTNIKKYLPESYNKVLIKLNDIAFNQRLKNKFINEHGVQTSLLRESSAEKALNEAAILLKTDKLEKKDISFKCKMSIPYCEDQIIFDFNFKKHKELPYRINILVGKNGTGKTQILTNLANVLSGVSENNEDRQDIFVGNRPLLDKVISISYSAFDSFKRRHKVKDEKELSYLRSYVYCGIQSEEGTLSLEMLRNNFKKAYELIIQEGRFDAWKSIMGEVMEAEHVELISQITEGNLDNINWSSGQHILVCTITEVLANIEKESIILFDEPEIHLHPNAISNTMRMLYRLLEEFDSYAIFATHSPLIIQEIPANYVHILERIHNILTIRRPEIECFGENITQITNEIFDVNNSESNYKSILFKMSKRLSYEEIIDLFGGELSFNAMIYLRNCCTNKEEMG